MNIFWLIFVLIIPIAIGSSGLSDNCQIIDNNTLICNNVTKEEINTFLSENNEIKYLEITSSNIGLLDASYINQKSAEKLIKLELNGDEINTITPGAFEYFPNLNTIELNHNQMPIFESDVLKNHINLETVFIQSSRIQRFETHSFSNLSALSVINLGGNPTQILENGTFSNLPNLYMLEISGMPLVEFPTFAFENVDVQNLMAQRCQFQQLHHGVFQTLTSLNNLDLSFNSIEKFPDEIFEPLSNLTTLTLISNRLSSFMPESLKISQSLSTLDLTSNSLTNLDLTKWNSLFPKLSMLILEGNPWQCGNLSRMLEEAKNLNTYIWWGNSDYSGSNINGIRCSP